MKYGWRIVWLVASFTEVQQLHSMEKKDLTFPHKNREKPFNILVARYYLSVMAEYQRQHDGRVKDVEDDFVIIHLLSDFSSQKSQNNNNIDQQHSKSFCVLF